VVEPEFKEGVVRYLGPDVNARHHFGLMHVKLRLTFWVGAIVVET
jgi:hypothetical protein